MGKYKEVSEDLKKYAELQFNLFTKKTGIKLSMTSEDFLNLISDSVDEYVGKNKNPNLDELSAKVDIQIASTAPDMIKTKLQNQVFGYSEEEFSDILTSFFTCIDHINVAYKIDRQIPPKISPVGSCAGIGPNKYAELYAIATEKSPNSYIEYNNEYSKVTKNHSATLIHDLKERTDKCKAGDEKALQETAAVYKRLKEKQKANSWFTNWFTRKGYKERAALKECKERLQSIYSNEFRSSGNTFEQNIEYLATKPDKVISDFVEVKPRLDKRNNLSMNDHAVEFYRFRGSEEKDIFLATELMYCEKLIHKGGDQIEVDIPQRIDADISPTFSYDSKPELEEEKVFEI